MKKIPILLVTHNRPYLLEKVLNRLIKYTPWDLFDLWILDNFSTIANKRIIQAFKNHFNFINVYSQNFNQISVIQNQVISKLKCDIYIKLDDDIFVTENWYKGFNGVFERNHSNLSIGSVIIPINGFGWIPFLKIMDYLNDFRNCFPNIDLTQGCMEPAVWNNPQVCEYIWKKALDMDLTARKFVSNQNGFIDYPVPYRYSIGAIIFSHDFWQKMDGWKVADGFYKRLKRREKLKRLNNFIANIRHRTKQNRIDEIIDMITKVNISALGIEEKHVFEKSMELGFKQYVTTENLVFHFSFFPTEYYLMENVYLKINW